MDQETVFPLQPAFVSNFAREWIEAWNSHDIERILAHYDDEIVLISPIAQKLLGGDGAVRSKDALRAYFLRGLEAFPNLRFDLIDVLSGMETIVLYYSNNFRGNKTAEVMLLNNNGQVRLVWANYNQ